METNNITPPFLKEILTNLSLSRLFNPLTFHERSLKVIYNYQKPPNCSTKLYNEKRNHRNLLWKLDPEVL